MATPIYIFTWFNETLARDNSYPLFGDTIPGTSRIDWELCASHLRCVKIITSFLEILAVRSVAV